MSVWTVTFHYSTSSLPYFSRGTQAQLLEALAPHSPSATSMSEAIAAAVDVISDDFETAISLARRLVDDAFLRLDLPTGDIEHVDATPLEIIMRRADELPDVLGIAEIAEALGVSRQRAHQLTSTKNFPVEIGRVRATRLWSRQDIEEFVKLHTQQN